jgi:hypothetical protein
MMGALIVRAEYVGNIDELTALSQRVLAFAQVTHAIALLDGSLW